MKTSVAGCVTNNNHYEHRKQRYRIILYDI